MSSLKEINAKIAQLEGLRDSGVLESSTDGVTIKFRTFSEIEAALNRLYRQKRKKLGKPSVNPWASPTFGGGS